MAGPRTAATKQWTYSEYAELDDGKRHEVIGGEIAMAPAPDAYHQDASRTLLYALLQFVTAGNCGKVYYAPFDVVLDDTNVVQPDLVFIARENLGILKRPGVFGAPDLVVEILSPSSVETDRYRKQELYERSGVKEYWIVDPENRTIEVLANGPNGFVLHSFSAAPGTVASKVLPGFEVAVESVMEEHRS